MPSPGPGATPSPESLDEHAQRAARAYVAAADHYNLPALSFWDRFGAATVARLPLAPGQRVLADRLFGGHDGIIRSRRNGARAGG